MLVGPAHPSSVTVPLRVDTQPPAPLPAVVRHGGADRFATAAAISEATFQPGVRVAYVASGEDFADALAAGPAAAREGGPVLLARHDALPEVTAAELARLQPGRIVLLGGARRCPTRWPRRPAAYAPVERRAGPTRFDTAAAASRAVFDRGRPVVYVATGEAYPDALAGAGAAALDGGPLLLTSADALPEATLEELQRLDPRLVVIVGGQGAIAAAVEDQLRAAGFATERRSGADRYATAAALTATRDPSAIDGVWAATGTAFPDALTAAPAAATTGDVILLVRPDAVPAITADEVQRLGASRLAVAGGELAIGPAVLADLEALLG